MRALHRLREGVRFVLAAVVLGGCASTPQATPGRDAEARQFTPRPDAAVVYVYRDDPYTGSMDMQDSSLYVDGRLIGSTLPGTFFRFDVSAGTHQLHGFAYDQGETKFDARLGDLVFVRLNVSHGTSHFTRVNPDTGKRELLRCCSLMENWAPGQRPLLR